MRIECSGWVQGSGSGVKPVSSCDLALHTHPKNSLLILQGQPSFCRRILCPMGAGGPQGGVGNSRDYTPLTECFESIVPLNEIKQGFG